MTRWPNNRLWGMGLFLTASLLLLAGCPSGGSDNCGGIDDIVSCVNVTDVSLPNNGQVDVADCNADGVPDPPVNPATMSFTFRNDAFPSFQEGVTPDSLDVQINRVSVTYEPQCDPSLGPLCPQLSEQSEAVTVYIPRDGGTGSASVTLVSASTKREYADGSDPAYPASYTAHFVFAAETVGFEDSFTIERDVPFTIGNFSCP